MQSEAVRPWRRSILVLMIVALSLGGLLWWEAEGRPGYSSAPEGLPIEPQAASRVETYRELCKAKELAASGDHKAALAVFEKVVQAEPDSRYGIDADIQAAHSMGFLGKHEEALARLNRIISTCSEDEEISRARLTKADVYSLSGQHEEALKLLEALIVEYTGVHALVCEEALVGMATVHRRTGESGLIRAALDRIIADYPGAEQLRRRWALAQVDKLRHEVSERQGPAVRKQSEDHIVVTQKVLAESMLQWGKVAHSYLITQPVVIPKDATLRVEAGTTLRFGVFGGLHVEGRLEVAGEPDQPVQFLPLSDDPARDWWVGIEVGGKDAAGTCRIRHATILGAETGIRAAGSVVELEHCNLDRCGTASIDTSGRTTLRMNFCRVEAGYRTGIECRKGDTLRITDSEITAMVAHGIILHEVGDGSMISKTKITRCGWDGVLVRGPCSPVIDGCVIAGNGGDGVRSLDQASPAVTHADVQENRGSGIHLEQRWSGAIRKNRIRNNFAGGLSAMVRCNGEIAGNLIENNGEFGMRLSLDSAPAVIGNRFVANRGVGLIVQNSQPKTLRDNQFVRNEGCALRNEGAAELQADHNWWGTREGAAIALLIEDTRTNSTWGKVTFTPWLDHPTELVEK